MSTAPSPGDTGRRRALKALRDGQVQVRQVAWGETRADVVEATVSGFTGRHVVELRDGRWTCSCKEGGAGRCPHALAVRLVTGHAGDTAAVATVTALPVRPADEPAEQGEVDCIHGMVASWCSHCTGRDGGEAARAQEAEQLLTLRGWTRAAFRGRCCQCSEPYAAGDPVRATPAGGRTAWAGACCGRR